MVYFQCLAHKYIMGALRAAAEDKSFGNAQECFAVVSEEFRAQGHVLEGPCAKAMRAGHGGQYRSNVSRDLKRHFRQLNPDDVPPIELDRCWVKIGIL